MVLEKYHNRTVEQKCSLFIEYNLPKGVILDLVCWINGGVEMLVAVEYDKSKLFDLRKVEVMVTAHAESTAEKTATFLRNWFQSLGFQKPIALPSSFYIEFSAILRISEWQSSKCMKELGNSFPDADELWHDLLSHFIENTVNFDFTRKDYALQLSSKTLSVYMSHCSATALPDLGVDIAISSHCNDDLLDLMADFLWQNRHLSLSTSEVQHV